MFKLRRMFRGIRFRNAVLEVWFDDVIIWSVESYIGRRAKYWDETSGRWTKDKILLIVVV